MALNVRLEFRDKAIPELTDGVSIIRLELVQEISETFELTLLLRSPASQIDMTTVLGEIARVRFFRDEAAGQQEPFLPLVEGMVRRCRQLHGERNGMSTYELSIAHQLWLFNLRRTHSIQRQRSAPEIFKAKIESRNAAGRVQIPNVAEPAQPTRVREYTVQYGETEYVFIRRILAEDGLAFYFTGNGLTTPTLVHDTSVARSSVQPALPYTRGGDALHGDADAVLELELGRELETTGKLVRDYNFDSPRFRPGGRGAGDDWEKLGTWADYSYEEGALHAFDKGADRSTLLADAEATAVAQRRVEALIDSRWVAECRTTCPIPVGAVLTVTGDHAVAGTPMTVVRARTLLEAPDESRDAQVTQLHRQWCVQASQPYRPRLIPKPRIHGIQRATVVGPEHIHVDEHGRVLLAFFWDITTDDVDDPQATDLRPTRRVPVSHGWAGPSHGFVTLPRCGDEVLVAYIDGDPDEPVVVGRVYNGVNRGEVKLPDDKTQSLWRTQSSPAKDGFHEIRFEDKSGGEELHIEAQRLHTRLVKGAEQVNVQGNRDITVDGTETEVIHEDHSRTVDGDEKVKVVGDREVLIDANYTRRVNGAETIGITGGRDLSVGENQMDHIGGDWLSEVTGSIGRNAAHHGTVVSGQANVFCASRKEETQGIHFIKATAITADCSMFIVQSSMVTILADSINLMAGGSAIMIGPGGVTITGPVVRIN